jgi:Transposase DDE domain
LGHAESVSATAIARRAANPLPIQKQIAVPGLDDDFSVSWARFKTAKGGVKAHVLLDHDDYMPRFVLLTTAKAADVRMARTIPIPTQSIVVCDTAYMDFSRFLQWTTRGIYFVCRLPDYPLYDVVSNRSLPPVGNILSDQIVQFTGRYSGVYRGPLRRITLRIEGEVKPLILVTNIMDFAARTVGRLYKDRWQIEVFFKTLKQNLKIKTFVGTTENALRIQIWTALMAILLLKWLHHLSKARWSLSNLASMLRLNLFTYRDLQTWPTILSALHLWPRGSNNCLSISPVLDRLPRSLLKPHPEIPISMSLNHSIPIEHPPKLSYFGQLWS